MAELPVYRPRDATNKLRAGMRYCAVGHDFAISDLLFLSYVACTQYFFFRRRSGPIICTFRRQAMSVVDSSAALMSRRFTVVYAEYFTDF